MATKKLILLTTTVRLSEGEDGVSLKNPNQKTPVQQWYHLTITENFDDSLT